MGNGRFSSVRPATAADYEHIVVVWEASVRATHNFVSEEDIVFYRESIPKLLLKIEKLDVYDDGGIRGFSGVTGRHLKMLFVGPEFIGQGIGSVLYDHAEEKYGVCKLEVNEENASARVFYERKGMKVTGLKEKSSPGEYSLLTMEK